MNKYQLQKLRDLPIEGVAERMGMQVVRHKVAWVFQNVASCPQSNGLHPPFQELSNSPPLKGEGYGGGELARDGRKGLGI